MAWTTTTLLAHIRRVASLPTAATVVGYADADLLAHADAQLAAHLLPFVAKHRDEHGVHHLDISATSEYVRLPPRVAAGHLRDVTRPSPSGGPGYVSVPRLEPEDASDWTLGTPVGPSALAVVLQSGFLRLIPAPVVSTVLRLSYVRTAPSLTPVSNCGLASNITPGTPNITVNYSGTIASSVVDYILLSNGDSLGDSVPAVGGGGTVTSPATSMFGTFANSSAECNRYVAEGVYLCPEKTSCVVPLPDLLSPLLAYRTAIAVMHSIGDREAADRLEALAERMTSELSFHIGERIEGEPQRVRPAFHRRARGLLRGW